MSENSVAASGPLDAEQVLHPDVEALLDLEPAVETLRAYFRRAPVAPMQPPGVQPRFTYSQIFTSPVGSSPLQLRYDLTWLARSPTQGLRQNWHAALTCYETGGRVPEGWPENWVPLYREPYRAPLPTPALIDELYVEDVQLLGLVTARHELGYLAGKVRAWRDAAFGGRGISPERLPPCLDHADYGLLSARQRGYHHTVPGCLDWKVPGEEDYPGLRRHDAPEPAFEAESSLAFLYWHVSQWQKAVYDSVIEAHRCLHCGALLLYRGRGARPKYCSAPCRKAHTAQREAKRSREGRRDRKQDAMRDEIERLWALLKDTGDGFLEITR